MSRGRTAPWRTRLLLLVIILLAFGLRLYRLEAKSLWWDESLSLYRAQHDWAYILSNRIDFAGIHTIDQHPPLYFGLLHLFVTSLGESDLILRFPSVLFGTLIVPLLYALGRRLGGERVGLLSALLGALSPFYLWYSQEARMYTMVTALGLAALYAGWRGLDERRWPWLLVALILALLAAATQYLFVLSLAAYVLVALASWLWRRERTFHALARHLRRPGWRRGALVLIGVIVVAMLGLLTRQVLRLVPTLALYRRYVPLHTMLVDVLNSFTIGLSMSLADIWPLDLFVGLVFFLGLVVAWRSPVPARDDDQGGLGRQARTLLLVVGLVVPVLGLWLFSLAVPVYTNSRYMMIASPLFYIGVALAMERLDRWRSWAGRGVLLVIMLGMMASNYRYFFHERYAHKENYRGGVAFVRRNERVGDLIVVHGPESVPAVEHYYDGPLPVVGFPPGDLPPEAYAQRFAELTAPYDRIWYIRARTAVSDPERRLQAVLDEQMIRQVFEGFDSNGFFLAVSAYVPHPLRQPAPDMSATQPLGAFGDDLLLHDYRVRYWGESDVPVTLSADHEAPSAGRAVPGGGLVSVAVASEATAPLPPLKTSLRLVRDGRVWGQRDRQPFPRWPTDQWPQDRVIRHETDLEVPFGTPPGPYDLELVLYHAETGAPLPYRDAAGATHERLRVGTLIVGAPCSATRLSFEGDAPLGRFEDGVELLAGSVGPQTVRPGDGLTAALTWRAETPLDRDYVLVINWRDEAGRVWHTASHAPLGVPYATSQWPADCALRGLVGLQVPLDAAPGQHTLHVLWHDPAADRFLWRRWGVIPWAGRDVTLGAVTVQPTP